MLRVILPLGIPIEAHTYFQKVVRRLQPQLQIQLEFSNAQPLDLSADVIIQFQTQAPPHGPYRTFVINRAPEGLLASQDYLNQHGAPRSVEELLSRRLLTWLPPGEDPRLWALADGREVAVRSELATDNIELIRQLVAAGDAIARLPDPRKPGLPRFERVLPELFDRPVVARVLIPERSGLTPRVRFVTGVIEKLVPSWLSGREPGGTLD